jgi:hypothetical protein
MKPLIIVALWTIVGWDVGAWAETLAGVPAVVGILSGIALGAALAMETRRRVAAASVRVRQVATSASSLDTAPALDRAA